jgi:hypothetical protein
MKTLCRGGYACQTGPGPWPGRRRPPVVPLAPYRWRNLLWRKP